MLKTGVGFTSRLPSLIGRSLTGCRVRAESGPVGGSVSHRRPVMAVNRSVTKLVVVAAAVAAVTVSTQTGSQPVARAATATATATATERGYPNAVPPILPVAGSSELRALESSAEGFASDPAASGGYSSVEMDAFASQCGRAC